MHTSTNLGAFWLQEIATVNELQGSVHSAILKAGMIGGNEIFPALGPLPLKDIDGMGAAVLQLLKTLDPAVNESTASAVLYGNSTDNCIGSTVGGIGTK
jgi:hypothetical protein